MNGEKSGFPSDKTVFIVGLGLMGASLAKALKKYTDCRVTGFDASGETEEKALAEGTVDAVGEAELEKADVIAVALYPLAAEAFLVKNASRFPKNAVITDLCGLKSGICRTAKELGLSFVGSHPMKGREKSGYGASTAELFKGANWVFTPISEDGEIPPILRQMVLCVGAENIVTTTPERHDEMIAYTSELPHIIAPSYIESGLFGSHHGFCGGSFEDITRVATLNAEMWSEIFCANSENITRLLDGFISSLSEYRELIAGKNFTELVQKLKESDERKRTLGGADEK